MSITYHPSPTAKRFHADSSFVRGVMGPVGSGKSCMCVMELFTRALEQAPHLGRRRSRWAIVRNSYRELADTTIKTFFDWIPEEMGVFERTSMVFSLQHRLPDHTIVQADFLFRALDRPEDTRKLLSLELTGAFINEAREIRKEVVDLIQTRIGRFPPKRDGGPTWSGLVMDSNPMDTDHWWFNTFETALPPGWAYFRQPDGMSPEAENIENLPHDYYQRMMAGKSQAWIDAYIHGKYSFLATGKPIYPDYNDHIHCSTEAVYTPGAPVILGADFGLTPAATFSQIIDNQWRLFHEITFDRAVAAEFVTAISTYLNRHCPGAPVEGFGDPSGGTPVPTDADTVFNVFRQANVPMVPACQQDDGLSRREALHKRLGTLTMAGKPAFILHPAVAVTRKGLAGGYAYRRLQVGNERWAEKPDKNRFSHAVESLEYAMLGAGEGYQFIRAPKRDQPYHVTRSMRQHRHGPQKAV